MPTPIPTTFSCRLPQKGPLSTILFFSSAAGHPAAGLVPAPIPTAFSCDGPADLAIGQNFVLSPAVDHPALGLALLANLFSINFWHTFSSFNLAKYCNFDY